MGCVDGPTPYQRELAQDVTDWQLFEAGLAAYERLSGVPEARSLDVLRQDATPAETKRLLSRLERMEEFRKLPEELQRRAVGDSAG